MSDLRQRQEPIRSEKYLAGSRGANCTIRFEGCSNDRDTVVPCHITDAVFGMARKADDISVVDGCHYCHVLLDTRRHGLDDGELFKRLLNALQETQRARFDKGLLFVPVDVPRSLHDKPTPPRKPKAERKTVPQRKREPAAPQRRASTPIPEKFEGDILARRHS